MSSIASQWSPSKHDGTGEVRADLPGRRAARAATPRLAAFLLIGLTGCATVSLDGSPTPGAGAGTQTREIQHDLPEALRVPGTSRLVLRAVAVGRVTYECQADPARPDAPRWMPVALTAAMKDVSGKRVGQLSGPPVVWEANDGSRSEARGTAGESPRADALPWQLVRVQSGSGSGVAAGRLLAEVDHVQQIATRGGQPRSPRCEPGEAGRRDERSFQADYLFWRSAAGSTDLPRSAGANAR